MSSERSGPRASDRAAWPTSRETFGASSTLEPLKTQTCPATGASFGPSGATSFLFRIETDESSASACAFASDVALAESRCPSRNENATTRNCERERDRGEDRDEQP